jgi:hypothetical protein
MASIDGAYGWGLMQLPENEVVLNFYAERT